MKILVNVTVPAVSQQYDILVPGSLRIRTIVSLIAETVESLSNHLYISSGEECLCSVEKNIILRADSTLNDYGIQSGDHLLLM